MTEVDENNNTFSVELNARLRDMFLRDYQESRGVKSKMRFH